MSFLILNLILSCSAAEPDPVPEPTVEEAPVKRAPPSVEGIDIDALETLLTSKSDKVRVFNFWATWCGPCVAELPMLREFAREHQEIELVLVSLDMHSVRAKRVIPYIAKYDLSGLTNYQLEDKDPSVAMRRIEGWPESIPVTLIVDKNGETQRQFNAALSKEVLTAALTTLGP